MRLFSAIVEYRGRSWSSRLCRRPRLYRARTAAAANFVAGRGTGGNEQHADRVAATTKWWRTLHDRELDSLIDRAIAGSPSLEIALHGCSRPAHKRRSSSARLCR